MAVMGMLAVAAVAVVGVLIHGTSSLGVVGVELLGARTAFSSDGDNNGGGGGGVQPKTREGSSSVTGDEGGERGRRTFRRWGMRNECARALHEPTTYGPNEDFSGTLVGVLAYAEMTYVICVSKCDMPVPSALRGRVLMVHGAEMDACLRVTTAADHWRRVSLSHGAAVAHAEAHGFGTAAVLEEDTTSAPNPHPWEAEDWAAFNAGLLGRAGDWNVVRLGYRPVRHEGATPRGCQEECACEAVGRVLCYMRAAGCALHSSDAYVVRRRAFDAFLRGISQGAIIDYGLLQHIPNQLVVTPQVNYQTKYAISDYRNDVPAQLEAGSKFREACMPASARKSSERLWPARLLHFFRPAAT